MKRISGLLFFLILLLIGAGGCGPTVVVNGERYAALTPEEEHILVVLARSSLKRSPKAIDPDELAVILSEEPNIRILYTGDRSGSARVGWDVNGQHITMVFRGRFLEDDMQWLLEKRADPNEIIDQSGRTPEGYSFKEQ